MHVVFYVAGIVALVATVMVITRRHAVHALLYFILSLVAIAVIFIDIGAPFVAALEIFIYAGAILVLFIFVIMLIGPGPSPLGRVSVWAGPALLGVLLAAGLIYSALVTHLSPASTEEITPKAVGVALFGPYILGVEFASLILLAGMVAAFHLGRRSQAEEKEESR